MKKMNVKIGFFDTKPYDREFFDKANQNYKFKIEYLNPRLNRETAILTKDFDIVCAFVNDDINKKVLKSLKNNQIKLIALRCAGYNNVDLKTAYGNINVVRVPGYSPYAVAEHAVALMLSLNRKTHRAYYRTRDRNFSIDGLLGTDFHGKTVGVIGTGKVGLCLINILNGFGMQVIAYDKYPNEKAATEKNFKYVELKELYKSSDIISLHCPLNKETYYLINENSIKQMKPGVMLINTGRGKLIKTEDLIGGLKRKIVGSAGLDVYEEESEYFFEDFSNSMISDDLLARLLIFPNVLITSHQGFFTKEALINIAKTTLDNIKEFLDGGYLKNEICYKCDNDCRKKQKKRCFS